MLNTKFDLYKTEWLDLVFDDRNKAYGAYDLRAHYAGTLNKAMAIAFTVVITGAVALSFAFKTEPKEYVDKIVDVYVPPIKVEPVKPSKPEQQKAAAPDKPQPQVNTIKDLPPVVTPDDKPTEEPPTIAQLQTAAAGTETVKGVDPGEGGNIPEPKGGGGGGTAPKANGDEIIDFRGVEVNPEPYGGMAAFGKFLGKALRFPPQAQDAGVSGRVLMSFVIEKNGEISNITVDKGAGYGFDQEAVRVLKLAKAWKPGMQNGQPVRVRYSIPINFQLPAE
ncbi:TonB family protein [Mucilaginibacter sp. ZT4R22]|uniref:TonB family protein n=1 Tax=Mucilaginibacter pankratovii TaxID=2772110 RepID=A0ABR7WJA6_9SPHI|nr:energy transducer TonB [Mucilaginibacter pankratovii]MBD1362241.1 TonB family protein [Mucilaginibacter pankratovii]